jgi:hypothetical protein
LDVVVATDGMDEVGLGLRVTHQHQFQHRCVWLSRATEQNLSDRAMRKCHPPVTSRH